MKLKKYLKLNKMTPQEFAASIDICVSAVYKYLNGVRPQAKTVTKIILKTDGKVSYKDLGYDVTYKAKRG
jgi:predicted transcriptional regulator